MVDISSETVTPNNLKLTESLKQLKEEISYLSQQRKFNRNTQNKNFNKETSFRKSINSKNIST